MSDFIQHPLLRLTLLFLAVILLLVLLRKTEPSWKIALIRGAFLGGLTLFLISISGMRWEVPGWIAGPTAVKLPSATLKSSISELPNITPLSETSPRAEAPSSSLSGKSLALILWAAVSSVLILRLSLTLIQERRLIKSGASASGEVTDQWAKICSESGLNATELIVVSSPVSPHLYLDGKLILPVSLIEDSGSGDGLVHLFRHEAAHLKAGDHFWFPFLSVLTAMLWFHPLAWWLAARHLVSCEEARDAEAARLGGADAYRQSVAKVALGLLPTSSPTPSLLRKNGRLVERLNRVERTSHQSPPLAVSIRAIQSALVVFALAMGLAAPTLEAALNSSDLFGMWKPTHENNRFARQVEVYEWGDEVKLRVWYSAGEPDKLYGATIIPFEMTKAEFEEALSERDSIPVPYRNSFQDSVYTLSRRGPELEIRVQVTYTDDSNRSDQDLVFSYERGQWSPPAG